MLTFILSMILICPAQAAKKEPALNIKWDLEVREVSRKYKKGSFPKEPVDAWWAIPERTKASPKAWRHAHAMVVAAFWAKRQDHRKAAMEWLKDYECENVLACDDLAHYFGNAMMENKDSLKDTEAKEAAYAVKIGLDARATKAMNRKPSTTGLCAPQADRAGWLELEYELFCPAPATPRQYGLCAGCEHTGALKFQLEMDSSQMLLSSSFVDRFEHRGSAACTMPWKAWIRCGGGIDATYTVDCERKGKDVSCSEKRKRAKK